MKKAALAALVLTAIAAAACHDPRPAAPPPPDYDATRRDAQKAQGNLDNSNGN